MSDKCPMCGATDIRYLRDRRSFCASCSFSWTEDVADLRRQLQQAQEELAQAQAENKRLRRFLRTGVRNRLESAVQMCKEIYAGNCVHRVKGVETVLGYVARKAAEAARSNP